jgi:hypothetical protein
LKLGALQSPKSRKILEEKEPAESEEQMVQKVGMEIEELLGHIEILKKKHAIGGPK